MSDLRFLKRFTDGVTPPFCPEILDIEPSLVNIPWLPIPVPKIEPDDWDLFWELWEKQKIVATELDAIWNGLCIWCNPSLTKDQIKNDWPKIPENSYKDWSTYFPKMFQQINEAMPFSKINKITLGSNIKPVPIHTDAIYKQYPWPSVMRVLIWDSNEKPTFYLTKWPEKAFDAPLITEPTPILDSTYFYDEIPTCDKIYVDLPLDTNTFVYSNITFLHGADLAKPKILLLVWGEPNPIKWKQRLIDIINLK